MTCICDACRRVSTMTLAEERSHCCGSTMHVLFENATEIFIPSYAFGTDFIAVVQHGKVVDLLLASDRRSIRGYLELGSVQDYIGRLDLGYEARNKNDIAVKEGNNVYLVRLVEGVPHILIRVDQRDDYTSCGDLLSPYERERIIDLALGQKRIAGTLRSTTGTRRRAAHGIGSWESVRAVNVNSRLVLEQLLWAAKRIIEVVLGRKRGNKMPCPTTQRETDEKKAPARMNTEQNARNTQADGEPKKAMPLIVGKKPQYGGWYNGATWHVALLIDKSEFTHNAKRRLALNALKKGIGIDQLTDQFSRLFKKQEEETRKLYADNAIAVRAARRKYERQQLEGNEPEPSGNTIKNMERIVERRYDRGGTSSWEESMGEVNWREIAWRAAEDMEMEIKAQRKNRKVPEFTEHDKGMLKSFGIPSALHASVQTEGTRLIPERSNDFVSSVSGSVEAMRCSQCGEMLSTDHALRKQHLETRHPGKLFHLVWKVQGHEAQTTKA